MSEQEQKLNIAGSLAKLAELLRKRFPDYDTGSPAESDRKLVLDARATEAQMVEFYSAAFDVPVLDEEEIGLPEQPPEAPLDFFNANDCLVYEWDKGKVTFLVSSPYKLGNLEYLVSRSWKSELQVRFVRRPFLERMLSKLQSRGEEQEEENNAADDENTLRSMAGEIGRAHV